MRTYFTKLLDSSQQHKQLPLVYPLLIALIAGAIFSFALAPYYYWWIALLSPALLYAVLRQRSAKQAFLLVGPTVLACGLSVHSGYIPPFMSMEIPRLF